MVTRKPRARARIDAEAAAWLARLQGMKRSAETDAALKDWLHTDRAHRDAFERATDMWDMLPGAAKMGEAGCAQPLPARSRVARRFVPALAAIFALLLIGSGTGYWWLTRPPSYVTDVGQLHVMTLDDGTRVALNTDTRLAVLYDSETRRVRLDRGEAMFEVAHNPLRPFIVAAGEERIRAIGTSFIVRRESDRVAVTLIEGKVRVSRAEAAARPLADLAPGERITVASNAPPTLDRPPVEAVVAWRRGEAIFDDTRLVEAADELNRYGRTKVVVRDPQLAALRVSGVFATNDAAEFASAIAQLHGLRVATAGDQIEIMPGTPSHQ